MIDLNKVKFTWVQTEGTYDFDVFANGFTIGAVDMKAENEWMTCVDGRSWSVVSDREMAIRAVIGHWVLAQQNLAAAPAVPASQVHGGREPG